MYLCPLNLAFPNVDKSITDSYTNKFNYIEANTQAFTIPYKENIKAYDPLNRNLTGNEYQDFQDSHTNTCIHCRNKINSNTIDILGIATLTFIFYTILTGK